MSDAASGSALTDPKQSLTFTIDGRPIPARAGQSIGAALYAAGVRTFSRSFKYHRPRGLLCVSGECPNCLMQVDGRPNVRTCVEAARPGQVVRSQNAWPSLNFDVLRVFDYLSWFLPVGFYYKRFHKPRWLWPLLEPIIRRIAGLGRIDTNKIPDSHTEVEHLHAEVCVIGGGPAGLAAATEAAASGAKVLLLERERALGGHLLFDTLGDEAHGLAARAHAEPKLQILTEATVFGLYEENLLGAVRGDKLLKIRAKHIIVCTGGRQRPFLYSNNDLPGIFLSDGLLRLARLHGVKVGKRAVVLTDCDGGTSRVPEQLRSLGMEVAAVVDLRPGRSDGKPTTPWPVLEGHAVVRARGRSHVKAVRIASLDGKSKQEIACDIVCMASRRWPANELLLQGGQRFRHEAGRLVFERNVHGLRGAGAVLGTDGLDAQVAEGRLRGAEAAAALGYAPAKLEEHRASWSAIPTSSAETSFPQLENAPQRKRFVCLCEDVTEKDLVQAMAEGFDNIETLKRYSTVNMGPCQGKMCGANAVEVCARITQRDVHAVGVTTSRPPLVPVDLCVLAADRHDHPVRRTPLHHWHEAAGARWLDAGLWKRPEHYGDPVKEVRAVRNGVGLIDVSTLGKIELIGPDAAALLERIYLNKWADLAVGRIRYGAMCNEEGILFDDGVGARRAADRFYLTATTGNADAVYQWLQRWTATWGLDVTIINQTPALAAMNLAGPRARDVLTKLTAVDVSATGFPYMAWRDADVAGVPCQLLRIGFVGELGYEIHCPAALAGRLWESLIDAGKEFALQPFGVEAQRMLRLEKGHIILGVDTDATSNPLEAGLEWMVRFEKPQFHGKEPLQRLKQRGLRSRLVGFRLTQPDQAPAMLRDMEGCQVVEARRPVGRITSARRSPTLDAALGLAWVPVAMAKPGQRFGVRCEEKDLTAEVAPLPFYDADMKRLKG